MSGEAPRSPMTGVTPTSGHPRHPCQPTPDTGVTHNHYSNHSSTMNGARGQIGALKNGSYSRAATSKKPRSAKRFNPASGAVYSTDFETFWQSYRDAMLRAGGKAAQNRNGMSKPQTFAVWQWLNEAQRLNALRFIPNHERERGEYMCFAVKYLSGVFENYVEDSRQRDDGHRRQELDALIGYRLGRTLWTQGMKDHWGAPPGDPSSRVPEDLWREAQTLAELHSAREVPHAA